MHTLWKRVQVKQTIYVKKQTKSSILTTFLLEQIATKVFWNLKRLTPMQEKYKMQQETFEKSFKKLLHPDCAYPFSLLLRKAIISVKKE